MNRQSQSFDTLCSPSTTTTTSYNSENIHDTINSFGEDDDIEGLSQKFDSLQRQIQVLTATQTNQDERYKRSKQENDLLLNKIHSLEDQLKELELNSEIRAKEDERRFKETMAKQMKIKSQECEQHLHANFLLQQEIFKLKNDLLANEAVLRALRRDKEELESELQEKEKELGEFDEEVHKLRLLVENLKHEESVKSNLISILNEELEDSQNRSQSSKHHHDQSRQSNFNNNYDNNNSPKQQRSSSSRRSSVTSGYEGEEYLNSSNAVIANNKALKDLDALELSLSKLKDENLRLKEDNEELQAQILNVQLNEGRSLVQEGNKCYSLADELGEIDVNKLMKALKEEQEDNARLRTYLDGLLLRVCENNPELLDKTKSSERKD